MKYQIYCHQEHGIHIGNFPAFESYYDYQIHTEED